MNSTKPMGGGPGPGELASLLVQLSEERGRMERLLANVEEVLRGATASRKPILVTEAGERIIAPARRSPLDKLKAVVESTADLREANGNLSAARVAKVFGLSLSQLAGWMGRTKQAMSKTPDADSLQEGLGYFERVARLRLVTKDDAEFRKWLRAPHELLNDRSPLDLLAKGEWQAIGDYVDDALTGAPT